MVLKYIVHRLKSVFEELLPLLAVLGIIVNFVTGFIMAIAIYAALSGYSDGRYPPNAVDLFKGSAIPFVLTLVCYTPFVRGWWHGVKVDYERFKNER